LKVGRRARDKLLAGTDADDPGEEDTEITFTPEPTKSAVGIFSYSDTFLGSIKIPKLEQLA
jgi:hypothetical protein